MRFGPYDDRAVEEISRILEENSIEFEVTHDEAHAEQLEKENNEGTQTPKNRLQFVGKWGSLFVEVPEDEMSRLPAELEKYGILSIAASSGDELREQYYCVQCDYTADDPIHCPTHRDPLVDYGKLMEIQNRKNQEATGFARWVLVAALIAGLSYFLFSLR